MEADGLIRELLQARHLDLALIGRWLLDTRLNLQSRVSRALAVLAIPHLCRVGIADEKSCKAVLLEAARHSDPWVRAHAVAALTGLSPTFDWPGDAESAKSAIVILQPIVRDESGDYSGYSFRTRTIGSHEWMTFFTDLYAAESDGQVAAGLVHAISDFDHPAVVPWLASVLGDSKSNDFAFAAAVRELRDRGELSYLDSAVARARRAAAGSGLTSKGAVFDYIGRCGRVTPGVIELLKENAQSDQLNASGVPRARGYRPYPSAALTCAAGLYAKTRDGQLRDLLITALSSRHRKSAASAISRTGDAGFVPILEAELAQTQDVEQRDALEKAIDALRGR